MLINKLLWNAYFVSLHYLLFIYFLLFLVGFPDSSVGKESTRHPGDLGSIPGLGRSPVEVKGYPLQYSGLENSMSWRRLSDFHITFTFLIALSLFLHVGFL